MNSPERRDITARQLEVLEAITRLTREEGYPPTIRELGAALEIASTNGVMDHLRALRKKGHLAWVPGRSRTLRVLRTG